MPAPIARSQTLRPGNLITLFDIDLTPLGTSAVFHFAPGTLGSRKPRWKGFDYEPVPITAEGFERNGRGEQPTPTLSMPATDLIIAAVVALDDLRRAKVTRWQVYEDNLDNGTSPADAYFPPDIYMIQRKIRHNTFTGIIEWELSTGLDLWGEEVPRRVATQRICMWSYRVWDGGAFQYSGATCPYAGAAMFNEFGVPVANPALDKCGKGLEDCELRFGVNAPLPIGSFPGIGSTR
jgi:lambda family phage minor tail protein L